MISYNGQDYLSTTEAKAHIFGTGPVNTNTLRRWLSKGAMVTLPGHGRTGFYPQQEVKAAAELWNESVRAA